MFHCLLSVRRVSIVFLLIFLLSLFFYSPGSSPLFIDLYPHPSYSPLPFLPPPFRTAGYLRGPLHLTPRCLSLPLALSQNRNLPLIYSYTARIPQALIIPPSIQHTTAALAPPTSIFLHIFFFFQPTHISSPICGEHPRHSLNTITPTTTAPVAPVQHSALSHISCRATLFAFFSTATANPLPPPIYTYLSIEIAKTHTTLVLFQGINLFFFSYLPVV